LNKKLICIGGPTASGKTALAMALAEHYSTAILSVDSRQVYKYFNIGTAKPTLAQRKKIPHYFLDRVDPLEKYSAGIFEREALATLSTLFERHDLVIAAGGTGFFFKALLEGLDAFPEVSQSVMDQLNEEFRQQGLPPLQEELIRLDPQYALAIDLHNPMRLLRALGVIRSSGKPFSAFLHKRKDPNRNFTPLCFALLPQRDLLYQAINQRVDEMIQEGLEEEVRSLWQYRETPAFNTVGYKEWVPYLQGIQDKEQVIDLIKRNTRRYAKRQFTWFQNQGNWEALRTGSPEECIERIQRS
jgi:tRNA dimethylallyltransferase